MRLLSSGKGKDPVLLPENTSNESTVGVVLLGCCSGRDGMSKAILVCLNSRK
jgi:hypothetical protein